METLLYSIEVTAVLVFAYSGLVNARRAGFDMVGVLTIGIVTAFGGGTIRDVLLGNHPLYWITHWEFLVFIMLLLPVELLLLRMNRDISGGRVLMIIDALGLGLFTASGVGIALAMNTPYLPAAFIGVITATFGGVIRDILCNQKPQLFLPTEPLYATCAFGGAWIYIGLIGLGIAPAAALFACIASVFILRIIAVRFDVKLKI
ncbi:MAG: trimeric intracellular cation channel family protein [Pyrinomonadaceae bacterium]|nr:trimeric intracellular cation channel family protein [Pyrinomonadaceae bacterium]